TRLAARAPSSSAGGGRTASARPPGSPFLEGSTVTVASAALLQRTRNAVAAVGGSLLSSEVKAQRLSKDGNIRIAAPTELESQALQQLLYHLESGMPFLFVDQLVVQPPAAEGKNGRMRVSLGISGRWRPSK